MGYPDTFEGFMISDQKKWTEFKKQEFTPKAFTDNDIDIKIECCGVCGSDVHTINGGWGEAPLPICVGHEVVGHAVKVGSKVKDVKEGDRVGVGAQVWACLKCDNCKSDNENYCPHQVGLTVWSPLVRASTGPGKKVAVVGLGGLGHFAVIWANALGADVTVISHSPHKKDDALALGAKAFVCNGDKNWSESLKFAFDFVLNTADMTHTFNINEYLGLCKVNAPFHQVGMGDEPLPQFPPQAFMPNGASISGSHIGSRPEILAMLKLAAEKKLWPMVETIPISAEGCAEAVERVSKNKVKYRFTLTDFDKAFGERN